MLEEASTERSMRDILEAARQWREKVGRPTVDSATLIREDRER